MFVVDINLIKHVKLSTLYTAKWRCRQPIYSQYKFENIVSYYVTYDKLIISFVKYSEPCESLHTKQLFELHI